MFAYFAISYGHMSLFRVFAQWDIYKGSFTKWFALSGDIAYVFGMSLFVMIFPLSPYVNAFAHFGIFMTFIICRVHFVIGRFVGRLKQATPLGWIFCSAYTLLSTVAIINVCVGFHEYNNTPNKADYKGLPMGVTASFMMDYAWVGMTLMVGRMVPDRDVPVYVST